MKRTAIVVFAALLASCSAYSERGSEEGGSKNGKNGETVRCDASPPNQPGCYTPRPSWTWWWSEKIHLRLGSED
jgi:hypothetical protein